jgi:hypothetical protein
VRIVSKALQDIASERARQITEEGWDIDHDDEVNDNRELARAAACYAFPVTLPGEDIPFCWPSTWDWDWWKPTTPRRDLVKAGALILAEIERLDRAGGHD